MYRLMGESNRILCVQIDEWKAIGFYVYRLLGESNRVICVYIDEGKAIGFYVYRLMRGKQYGSMCTD